MAAIMKAWAKRGKVYHVAAGHGPRTACGIRIAAEMWWTVGEDVPAGRTLCSRCVAMQRDAGKRG